jgi:hypothetical protein
MLCKKEGGEQLGSSGKAATHLHVLTTEEVLRLNPVQEGEEEAQEQPSHSSDRGAPGSIAGQVTWDLWWTKCHWDIFSRSTSVSPACSHSTKYSILIYHWGW